MPDETLFGVFDIASQTDHSIQRKRMNKSPKSMLVLLINIGFLNHRHASVFFVQS